MTRIFAIAAAALAAVAVGIASYAAVSHDSKTVVREVTVSGGTPTAATSSSASAARRRPRAPASSTTARAE